MSRREDLVAVVTDRTDHTRTKARGGADLTLLAVYDGNDIAADLYVKSRGAADASLSHSHRTRPCNRGVAESDGVTCAHERRPEHRRMDRWQ